MTGPRPDLNVCRAEKDRDRLVKDFERYQAVSEDDDLADMLGFGHDVSASCVVAWLPQARISLERWWPGGK